MNWKAVIGLVIGAFITISFLKNSGSTNASWFGPQTAFDERFEVGATKNRILTITLAGKSIIDATVSVIEGDPILIAFSQNPLDNFPQSVSYIPGLLEKSTRRKQFKGTLPAGKYWIGIATTGIHSNARAVVDFKMTVD